MRVGSSTCWVLAIFIICNLGCICGGEEEEEEESLKAADGLEEVSIEAVDDDDDVQSSISRPHSIIINQKESDTDEIPPFRSNGGDHHDHTTDNSTAIATVYPDIGASLANGSASGGLNGTGSGNGTVSRVLRVKVVCSVLYPEGDNNNNNNDTEVGTVEVANMTYLLHGLLVTNPAIKVRTTPSNCTVVLFYTHWCPWSAKAAPHFNALPRAFRNIRFAAIDSSVHTAINTYFGVLSVPSVVLFYNGKLVAKFNDTTFNVNQLAEFISTFTDQTPGIRLNVTSADFIGPIPSLITKGIDWYLLMSWAFIIFCFIYYVSKTAIWHRVLELMQNSWREAEAVASVPPQHFHQD